MKGYYVYLKPEKDEPYRFVTGVRKHWLFWQKPEYSWLPTVARVNDYEQLHHLQSLAAAETGREIVVTEADEMAELHRDNLYWANIRKDTKDVWFTGRIVNKPGSNRIIDETTSDVTKAQLYVRKHYAIGQQQDLMRNKQDAVVVPMYVATKNVFCDPCIVIVCVNKLTKEVRYLKSYKVGDHRLRYTDRLSEALLINVEDVWKTDERLTPAHKNISFTFIVRPEYDIAANKLREHEKELVQRIACDYYIGHHGKKERTKG